MFVFLFESKTPNFDILDRYKIQHFELIQKEEYMSRAIYQEYVCKFRDSIFIVGFAMAEIPSKCDDVTSLTCILAF